MRRATWPIVVLCGIACNGENADFVRSIVECQAPNQLTETSLGTLRLSEQTWGLQARAGTDGQTVLEVFYRAELTVQLAEAAEGFEVVVPYELRLHTPQSIVINPPEVVLEPEAPWTEAATTINLARRVDGGFMFEDGDACDSFAVQLGKPALLPTGTMNRAAQGD